MDVVWDADTPMPRFRGYAVWDACTLMPQAREVSRKATTRIVERFVRTRGLLVQSTRL